VVAIWTIDGASTPLCDRHDERARKLVAGKPFLDYLREEVA
jgi:hypothetical protein